MTALRLTLLVIFCFILESACSLTLVAPGPNDDETVPTRQLAGKFPVIEAAPAPMILKPDTKTKTIALDISNSVVLDQPIAGANLESIFGNLMFKRMMNDVQVPIYLVLESPGGEVEAAGAFMGAIVRIPNLVLVCGTCESAAAMIFEGKPMIPRLVTKNSYILMHEMYESIHPSTPQKEIDDFRIAGALLNKIFEARLGWTDERYKAAVVGSELIYQGNNIKEAGLADEYVNFTCDDYVNAFAPRVCP
jgi:ATP-dependent protease ClpP protease subunit